MSQAIHSQSRFVDANIILNDLRLMAKYQNAEKQSTIIGVCKTIEEYANVESVNVTFCCDCEHWHECHAGFSGVCWEDSSVHHVTKPDHYCAYGIPRKRAELDAGK